jgi:demethylmenaquinone methyltransferase/2-methoxy-6-polyprenyl-1,4-benzoquinol methylase
LSRYYDLFAGTGEHNFTAIGLQMLAVHAGENVLEIGFGTGHSLVELAQAAGISGKATGIDISKGMLRVTQTRLKRSGLTNRIDLRLGDAVDLPFIAAGFDAVLMSFTLELFDSSEIPLVLNECHRVLRPEGRLGVVALERTDVTVVKVYDWAHAKFPAFIDCRPILVSKVLEEARFRIRDTEDRFMWGLPVKIVLATK